MPNKPLTDDQVVQLTDIVKGIIDEFGARERRTYMVAAFTNRARIDINFNVRGIDDLFKTLAILGRRAVDMDQAVAEIKEVYAAAMTSVMAICDQSLLGLVSLIDVYRARMLNIPIERFDVSTLKPHSGIKHNYTYDERLKYAGHLDQMKLSIVRQYFNHEVEARLLKGIGNYYSYVQKQIGAINTADEKALDRIEQEFNAFKTMYEAGHTFAPVVKA